MLIIKKNVIIKHIIIIFSVIALSGCNIKQQEKIREGYIEYNVIYLNKEKESLYSFMLPKKMVVKFKKNKIKSTMEGFSGNFSFSSIVNTKNDSIATLFQIMNRKYYYLENSKGQSDLFGELPGAKISFNKDTLIIADLKCKKANIESDINSFSPFEVYYTKEIKMHNPNKKNPYYQIDGILMDFYLKMFNMDMRFVANNVIQTEISDSEFKIPQDFKRINRKTVDKLICMLE